MRRNKRRGQRREQKLDLFREFLRLVEEMAYDVDAAIVEGRHDEKTLRMSGFGRPIVRCSQTKRSFQELVDYIARRFSRVVILADFDEKGEEISNRLATHLERRGIA
ncbi:TPA: hypothetical protein EYP44_02255, partial [Candidatus Bathyarchaeota archaeon]|nr:hypothetical protein [Candidatus Bathyarchaeota archaeon]